MTEPLCIFLADDHPLIRAGIRTALVGAPDLVLVGEAANGHVVRQRCGELAPDMVLLDLHMPGPPPFTLIAELRADHPNLKIVILTAYADDIYVRGCMAAGAVGYILKDEDAETIVRAIRTVAQGSAWVSPAVATKLVGMVSGEQPASLAQILTTREMAILRLVAISKTNREIGALLGMSEKTVERHMSGLFAKLGVKSRVEAAIRALREGLVEGSPAPTMRDSPHEV
jgi:DNA-binding NarL/FixJ family response regulator